MNTCITDLSNRYKILFILSMIIGNLIWLLKPILYRKYKPDGKLCFGGEPLLN